MIQKLLQTTVALKLQVSFDTMLRMSEFPTRNEHISVLPPVSIEQLFDGNIPLQPEYKPRETGQAYRYFASKPMTVLTVDDDTIVATLGAMDGEALTYFFHFAAPSKYFGVDHPDTREDWTKLFTNPRYAKLLEKHRKIPGWEAYEPFKDHILQVIKAAYEPMTPTDKFAVIAPVICLKKPEGREFGWNFAPLSPSVAHTLLKHHPSLLARDENLLPILGPLLVAAYSPSVTATWAGSDGRRTYAHPTESLEGSQNMGSTQVVPLTIGESGSLIRTPFVRALVRFAKPPEKYVPYSSHSA